MHNTLLITPMEWWILIPSEIKNYNIEINDYLKNTGDGLALKRTILNTLKNNNYPYHFNVDISFDKEKCKNRETSKILYDYINSQIKKPFL